MTPDTKINAQIKILIDQNRTQILKVKAPSDPDILVYDGIVADDQFRKILFLLKDGNNPNLYDENGNYVKNGSGYTYLDLYKSAMASTKNETDKTRVYLMWKYMCLMIRIIEDPDFMLKDCWSEKRGFDVDTMRSYLLHIATVNIKKSAGKGTNDKNYDPALRNAVAAYYDDLIKEEISLIRPEIVICGGTFDYIKGKYDITPEKLPNGKRYFIYEDCIYLEYWHPSARFGYKKHFNCFKETYTQLKAHEPAKSLLERSTL